MPGHAAGVKERLHVFGDSKDSGGDQLFALCHLHNLAHAFSALLRPNRPGFFKPAAGNGPERLFAIRHGQQIRVGMLDFAEVLRRLYHAAQAVFIQLVAGGARRATAEYCAHRDRMVLIRHILVNCIVGEACQRAAPAGDVDFDLVCRGDSLHLLSNFVTSFFSKHSAFGKQSAFSNPHALIRSWLT